MLHCFLKIFIDKIIKFEPSMFANVLKIFYGTRFFCSQNTVKKQSESDVRIDNKRKSAKTTIIQKLTKEF